MGLRYGYLICVTSNCFLVNEREKDLKRGFLGLFHC